MREKNTSELENVLGSTHVTEFQTYCRENQESIQAAADFRAYMKEQIHAAGMTQQRVFLEADIPERYGYKLLSGEKHTRRRDVILRICYAARMPLEETQRALRKYQLPELYAKLPRDALLMLAFHQRPGDLSDVCDLLESNGFPPLQEAGVLEEN